MGKYKLPHWLQAAVAASGGLGLFLLAFLDSSFLPFPTINDLLLIDLCFESPRRMPYYAAMATLGSIVGSLVLYFIARKGGEAAFRSQAGSRADKIRHWVERNGFVSMVIAAVLPPPTPFKFFVLAAGAFEMPLGQFVLSLVLARGARFYGEGYLAVRYGDQATRFLVDHKVGILLVTIVSLLVFSLGIKLLFRRAPEPQA
jgi:membrane protein YqaA with SNARE-associated domain